MSKKIDIREIVPLAIGGLAIAVGSVGLWWLRDDSASKKKEDKKTSKKEKPATPKETPRLRQTKSETKDDDEEKNTSNGTANSIIFKGGDDDVKESPEEANILDQEPDFGFRGSLIRQLSEDPTTRREIHLEDEDGDGDASREEEVDMQQLAALLQSRMGGDDLSFISGSGMGLGGFSLGDSGVRDGGEASVIEDDEPPPKKEAKDSDDFSNYNSTVVPFSISYPSEWNYSENKHPLEDTQGLPEGSVVWKTPDGLDILSVHWCEYPPSAVAHLKGKLTSKMIFDQYLDNQLAAVAAKLLDNPKFGDTELYYAPIEHNSLLGDGTEKKGFLGVLLTEDYHYHFIVWFHPDKKLYEDSDHDLEKLGLQIIKSFKYRK